jgi:hypothetical protein
MSIKVEALITPALLSWGRKTAGYDLEEAAANARRKPEAWSLGRTDYRDGAYRPLSSKQLYVTLVLRIGSTCEVGEREHRLRQPSMIGENPGCRTRSA